MQQTATTNPAGVSAVAPLTQRETELVTLLAQGGTVKAAAVALGIAHKTAETHVSNVNRKLAEEAGGKRPGRAGLVRFAVRKGLVKA